MNQPNGGVKMFISNNLEKDIVAAIEYFIKINSDIQNESFIDSVQTIRKLLVFSELLGSKSVSNMDQEVVQVLRNGLKKSKNFFTVDSISHLETMGVAHSLGEFYLAVNNIHRKTGELNRLLDSLENQIIALSVHRKDMKNRYSYYDLISGPTGIIYNLLDSSSILENDNKMSGIREVISYLITLCQNYDYKGKMIPKYHVLKNKRMTSEEMVMFPDGYIDFGMAHGILAPLITLSKVAHMGIYIEGLDRMIKQLKYEFERFSVVYNGILSFPSKLSIYDYRESKKTSYPIVNGSWCYGNLSILRGLMKVSKYCELENEYEEYEKMVTAFLGQDMDYYGLNNFTLCHGLCSVISVQLSTYYERKNPSLIHTLERNLSSVLEQHLNKFSANSTELSEEEKYYGIEYRNDFSLLNGVGGVISVLNHSIEEQVSYNRALLID